MFKCSIQALSIKKISFLWVALLSFFLYVSSNLKYVSKNRTIANGYHNSDFHFYLMILMTEHHQLAIILYK